LRTENKHTLPRFSSRGKPPARRSLLNQRAIAQHENNCTRSPGEKSSFPDRICERHWPCSHVTSTEPAVPIDDDSLAPLTGKTRSKWRGKTARRSHTTGAMQCTVVPCTTRCPLTCSA